MKKSPYSTKTIIRQKNVNLNDIPAKHPTIYMAATTAMAKARKPVEARFTMPPFTLGTVDEGPAVLLVVLEVPLVLVEVEVALVEALVVIALEDEDALVVVVVMPVVVVVLEVPVVVAAVVVETADVVWGAVLVVIAVVVAALLRPVMEKRGRKLYWPVESSRISTV